MKKFAAAMKTNGPTGRQLSNSQPPTKATIMMPSAPQKLYTPSTAPRPRSGASLPMREVAEIFDDISPAPTKAAAMYMPGPRGFSRSPRLE